MCHQCSLNPVYEFTNKKKLCKNCFLKYFNKKFLYIIRKFGMVRDKDIIGYYDKKDFRSAVLKDTLNLLSEKSAIEIVKMPNKKANKNPNHNKMGGIFKVPIGTNEKNIVASYEVLNPIGTNKIADSSALDLEADKIIHVLINDKISKLKKSSPVAKLNGKTIIKPLYLFLDEEILLYAKIKKIKFKEEKLKKDKITIFIGDLEKKHPEIKHAIVNSVLKIGV